MNTKLHQRIISKVFPIDRSSMITEIIILSLLGALAVVLRAKLRIPLNMPGHHGLEVMAILLIGRHISKISIASSISSLAAALFIFFPFLGFKDPFLPLIYIIMGVSIDVLYTLSKKYHKNFLSFAIIGGLAYSMIPICRILIQALGFFEYTLFIKRGFIVPIISHFIFGFAGGLLATSLVYFTKKQFKRNKH